MKVFTKKIGMTQIFDKNGNLKPVTVLELSKTVILRKKTIAKDGYSAVLFGRIKENFIAKKSVQGQFKDVSGIKQVKEQRLSDDEISKMVDGEDVLISIFSEGDKVVVSGISKGKGFAGTVKRHGFATGPKTHGSHNYRAPGSIGPTYPQRTILGRKMSGHMGATSSKVKNLTVERVEKDLNRIWVSGSVPGPNKGCLMVEKND